jgi:hypothetical protein
MLIVVTAPNGVNTTNMFANTNINFSDLILWNPSVPCNNCEGLERLKVTNDKQSNGSKKMLQAKMIKQRKQISYQNTNKQNAYNIIYSHNFYDNINLISKCNSQYYVNLIKVLLRSNNVSSDRKAKIRDFMSRIII